MSRMVTDDSSHGIGDHRTAGWPVPCAAVLIGERRAAGADGVAKPNAKLVTMAGEHVVHFDAPLGFASRVGEFLDEKIGDCRQ
jgi:hypothetical protein